MLYNRCRDVLQLSKLKAKILLRRKRQKIYHEGKLEEITEISE